MRRLAAICLVVAMVFPAWAVEGSEVAYIGGTAAGVKAGAVGTLDMTSTTALVFRSKDGTTEIPYSKIDSYEYSQELTRHLGALTGVTVSLLRHRKKRHYLRISYRDNSDAAQAVVFEISKEMPKVVLAALDVRAPQKCRPMSECRSRTH